MKQIKNLLIGVALVLLASLVDKSLSKEDTVKQANRDWLTALEYWALAFIFIIVLALLAGCAPARQAMAPKDGTSVINRRVPKYHNVAITTCGADGDPVITFLEPTYKDRDLFLLYIHEHQHVKQLTGNCAAKMARYGSDPEYKRALELDAYCEQARHAILMRMHPDSVWAFVRDVMREEHGMENASCNPP